MPASAFRLLNNTIWTQRSGAMLVAVSKSGTPDSCQLAVTCPVSYSESEKRNSPALESVAERKTMRVAAGRKMMVSSHTTPRSRSCQAPKNVRNSLNDCTDDQLSDMVVHYPVAAAKHVG